MSESVQGLLSRGSDKETVEDLNTFMDTAMASEGPPASESGARSDGTETVVGDGDWQAIAMKYKAELDKVKGELEHQKLATSLAGMTIEELQKKVHRKSVEKKPHSFWDGVFNSLGEPADVLLWTSRVGDCPRDVASPYTNGRCADLMIHLGNYPDDAKKAYKDGIIKALKPKLPEMPATAPASPPTP